VVLWVPVHADGACGAPRSLAARKNVLQKRAIKCSPPHIHSFFHRRGTLLLGSACIGRAWVRTMNVVLPAPLAPAVGNPLSATLGAGRPAHH
jgi:hypothetical protein